VNMIVRVYEKGQIESDVCVDFMKTVCPGALGWLRPENQTVNSTPDRATVELLRMINTESNKEQANRARRRLMSLSPQRQTFAPHSYFSPDQAKDFMSRFAASNEMVAREFLGRPDGVLFRDPSPAAESGQEITPDAVLNRAVELLRILAARPMKPGAVSAGPKGQNEKLKLAKKKKKKQRHEIAVSTT
jgi:hypothetical protein